MIYLTAKGILTLQARDSVKYEKENKLFVVYGTTSEEYTPAFIVNRFNERVKNTANEKRTIVTEYKVLIAEEGLNELTGFKYDEQAYAFKTVKGNLPLKSVLVEGVFYQRWNQPLKKFEKTISVKKQWHRFKLHETGKLDVEKELDKEVQATAKRHDQQAAQELDWE